MTKLKPCPNVLCGSEDVRAHHRYGVIECEACDTRVECETIAEAIAYWHDRPQVVDAKRLLSSLHKLRDNVNNDYNLNMLDSIIEKIQNGGYDA